LSQPFWTFTLCEFTRNVVLIGAGHTNMHIVRMWKMHAPANVKLTLVSPFSRATYSGMLPGTLAGLYQPHEMEIDLFRFTAGSDVRVIIDSAAGLAPEAREIHFADRPPIRFDIASVGIGSVPAQRELWANSDNVLSIKPMATFLSRLENRLESLSAAKSDELKIVVVGAGAAGCEISMCLQGYLETHKRRASVMLLDRGADVLKGYSSKAVALVRREFERRGIETLFGESVEQFEEDKLVFSSGKSQAADIVIWAASAAPPPELEGYQLTKSDDGFLAVRQTLRTVDDFPVFVVGDTATLVDHPVRKSGVYAVREGPFLWDNICRSLEGRELVQYDPQAGFLSLLATGDGRAIADYKGTGFSGRWAWHWKDYLDRKFMRMYQTYTPTPMTPVVTETAQTLEMRCRGCGGKVGASVLAQALERLDIPASRFARQGLDEPDDAALLDPTKAIADVVTIDFFQAFIDDPYIVGRVAMLNALSDVWAMGAKPIGALTMAVLPRGPSRQQAELLFQLLAGALKELNIADADLLGGHTTEGSDLTIGFNVLGSLDGKEPTTKSGLQPGDQLILTKSVGTGALLVGHGHGDCRAEWMDEMLASMLISNQRAAQIAREFHSTAITDVTGFGLAGHLFEMLDASNMSASLELAQLPLLSGFSELADKGHESTLAPANREVESRIESPSKLKERAEFQALFDPQTSGGLLIAIAKEKSEALVSQLREDNPSAKVIGQIESAAESGMDEPMLRVD
ncbi:MAG: selenide, water dikinase SelD, partial [Planctomycetaceae bacterium]|nr:selenide, water dikinase SelD [Planctomycetaceae bacterium]